MVLECRMVWVTFAKVLGSSCVTELCGALTALCESESRNPFWQARLKMQTARREAWCLGCSCGNNNNNTNITTNVITNNNRQSSLNIHEYLYWQ